VRSLCEQVTTPSELSIAVLFAASTPEFRRGYEQVRQLHPDTQLHEQDSRPVKRQIQDLVEGERREFFSFFVDDIVAVRPFGWSDREFALLRTRPEVASLSLRLHPRISHCQPLNLDAPAPPLDADRTWDWTYPRNPWVQRLARLAKRPFAKGDWAGSMFLDGQVFRHPQFIEYFALLPEIPYVTKIESVMLSRPLPGRRVACYAHARIVNVVLNRVDQHSGFPHAGGSAEEMNARFLEGERLTYERLGDRDYPSCHVTVEPAWIRA
jgi:hypothetical protein